MKLCLVSDLHFDFCEDEGDTIVAEIPNNIDLLCVAGDVGECRFYDEAVRFYGKLSKNFERVVFVLGNHEYLHKTPEETECIIQAVTAEYDNLTWLDRGSIPLTGDKRLHGATLWYPDHEDNRYYSDNMIDFGSIKSFVPWVYYRHNETVQYLRNNVNPGDIIMTHHAPHRGSIAPRFETSSLNRFFVSDQSEIIYKNEPGYWFHGHMHMPFDYVVDKTNVICSPFGYPGENNEWKPRIIEIE